ncbi:MAG: TonB-dependent receptor [Pseudomonadota bacterium]
MGQRKLYGGIVGFWILLGVGAAAMGQSTDEMNFLNLFFPREEMVVSATRYPKPISKAAENMSIITAAEIRNMNAHTVADILNRIPGLFVNFNQDFGATSLLTIQGSEDRHVLVMLDGMRWNFLAGGNAETNTIPVGIIERIEIIKGPASSAWGSALGGVVNIITRQAGNKLVPGGSVSAAVGESGTLDTSGQVAGQIGVLGYYLYAGKQESNGLWGGRDYDNGQIFSKFRVPLSDSATLTLSAGLSEPENNQGAFPEGDLQARSEEETHHLNTSLEARLTDRIDFEISLYHLKQKLNLPNVSLGLSDPETAGDLYLSTRLDEKTAGGGTKLIWKNEVQTAVLGVDFEHGELDQSIAAGEWLQSVGAPAHIQTDPRMDRYAVFLNDTISLDRISITPGIRLDDNSITDSFFSPSLGITYNLKDKTLFRGTIARGMNYPALAMLSGGGFFVDPNPDLEPETVWSYQAGIETVSVPFLWLKANLFFHDQEKSIARAPFAGGPPNYNDLYLNSSGIRRQGLEVEVKTKQVHHLSFSTSGAYIDLDHPNDSGESYLYTGTLGVEYSHPDLIYAQLFGRYVEWALPSEVRSNNSDIVWELNLNRKLFSCNHTVGTVFLTLHNLFNGSQYQVLERQNPQRWGEVGFRYEY